MSKSISEFARKNPKGSESNKALLEVLKIEEIWKDYVLYGDKQKSANSKSSSHKSFDDVVHGRQRPKRDSDLINYNCYCQEDNCNALELLPELRKFVSAEYDRHFRNETHESSSSLNKSSQIMILMTSMFSILSLVNQRILS